MTTRAGTPSRRAQHLPLLAAGIAATVGVAMRPQLAAAPPPPIAATDPISVDASIKPKAMAPAGPADGQIPPGERERFVATDDPAFEAASVKRNRSGDARSSLEPQPGGRLTATNVTAALLIQFALRPAGLSGIRRPELAPLRSFRCRRHSRKRSAAGASTVDAAPVAG
jgi:hypothetical protein